MVPVLIDNIFLVPGSLEGTDVVLPASFLPNVGLEVEEVVPAALAGVRGPLITHVVLLRPKGWQTAVKRAPKIKSWDDVQRVVQHLFFQDFESVVVLVLNASGKLMAIHEASSGGQHSAVVDERHAVKVAALVGGSAVVIVHNHPSGNPEPSAPDLALTAGMTKSFDLLGICLLDHVIVSSSGRAHSLLKTGDVEERRKGSGGDERERQYSASSAHSSADAQIELRSATPEGFLRRLWGGHAKLVVRTGLVPGRMPNEIVDRSKSAVRVLKKMGLSEGDLVVIGLDGANNMRGARVVSLARLVKTSDQLARDALGFLLSLSASASVLGYMIEEDLTNEKVVSLSRWIVPLALDIGLLMPCVDIVVIDGSGKSLSFQEASML